MKRWLIAFLLLSLGCGCELEVPDGPPVASTAPQPTTEAGTGPLQVYFTKPVGSPGDPGSPAAALAGYINKARETIDVCAFELDNQIIVEALVNAVRRGVRVRLVTETDYLEESGVHALQAVGVPIVDDQRDGALMHDKFMVFDGRSVWTGSMNFTENCAYRNNNHGIYVDDTRIAANYATKFGWMFEQRKFGGLPTRTARIPHPTVILRDGTRVENYFSSHDHVADRLVAEIGRAQSSIHFLAFSFTHDGIGAAMRSRSEVGVGVQGVFEKSQAASSYSEYSGLAALAPRVEVYLDANPRNMHHKVIILDYATVVAGSFNFSEGADRQNDENVLIIHNRAVAQQFEREFQKIFADGKRAAASLGPVSSAR